MFYRLFRVCALLLAAMRSDRESFTLDTRYTMHYKRSAVLSHHSSLHGRFYKVRAEFESGEVFT